MTAAGTRVSQLAVWLGDTRVGTIAHLPGEVIAFSFDPDYEADRARPTLSLSRKTSSDRLLPIATTRVKLPSFFSNLLPEGHLRTYLAARGGVKPIREYFLLRALGDDLSGAVRITTEHESPGAPLSGAEASRRQPNAYHFSLAGLQLKFSALAEAEGGLTIPVSGTGGDWIVKLPSSRFAGVPEHEHAMLALAASIGIDVPEHRLVPIAQIDGLPTDLGELAGPALAVRRFDRDPGAGRIHIEDFAQVFNVYPRDKYARASSENIATVLWAEAGLDASLEFVRRLVFGILTGNADMHLKNWSVRYADRRTPALAPAYDLVGTVAFLPNDELALSLGGEKIMSRITLDHFERLAVKVGLPLAAVEQTVLNTAQRFRAAWRDHPAVGTIPTQQRVAITTHTATLPLHRLGGGGSTLEVG